MATQRIPITGHQEHHVHAERNGQVDNDTVHVSKSAGHQVTWSSSGKAVIEFSTPDGSPFEQAIFRVPAGGSVSSGPARDSAQEEKAYKYSVEGEEGVNDPTVIIHG